MNTFKKILLSNPITKYVSLFIRHFQKSLFLYLKTSKKLNNFQRKGKVIFYLGIPAHSNLGDLAQGMCIRRWLKKNYPDHQVVEIETDALVNTYFPLLNRLAQMYQEGDMIVYQSGYTTTDLGGFADEMHRAVMSALPQAKMLMLPQTIYFQKEENKKRTSYIYNGMKKMLFLARDRVSYGMAKEMFPDIPVRQFPDIVTTLIGNYSFNNERDGVLLCCRDDGEKFYSDEELQGLINKLEKTSRVYKTDTTKTGKKDDIVENAEKYILEEIESYSHYKVIITDRYHGTIFSLVAGTPVVIIKTTDHKVITGAEWFKGVYDSHVFVAENLEDAYEIAKKVIETGSSHTLQPYFEKEYYDKLPEIFEKEIKE